MEDTKVKTGKFLVNRLFLGIQFLILYGLAGGIAAILLGTQINGSLQSLGAGIENINSFLGLGQIVWFAISTLIIAAIAIALAKYKRYLTPFRHTDDEADIPKKVTLVTAIVMGALISLLLWILSSVLKIFGQDLTSTDVLSIYNALVNMDFIGLFVGLIFAVVVGIIVIGVANNAAKVDKVVDDVGINKF